MFILKKYISLLLVLSLILASFSACGAGNNANNGVVPSNNAVPAEPTEVRIGSLTGPTTIGLVKLLSDAEEGKTQNKYISKIAGSADELTPLLIKGDLDVFVGPSNLAAVLYNKTEGKVQMAAVSTLGVLGLLTTDSSVKSWADLKGRTIYATGKGSTPEYVLSHLLSKNGLQPGKDVTIEFKSEPAEIVAMLKTGGDAAKKAVVMLPQPFATAAQTQVEGLAVVMDLASEWDKLADGSRMVTACIMVRKEFAEAHPEAVAALLKEYKASAEWVNQNVDKAAELTEKYINIKAGVAKKAIPLCSVVCITGSDMKAAAAPYLKVLFDANPASVGGKLPADDFYLQ